MKKRVIILIILLSATFFNLAFFFPKYCGWLIIISLLIPFYFLQLRSINLKQAIQFGFLFGIFIFSFHFLWLADMLLNKLNISIFIVIGILLFIIIYFSFFCSIWFFLVSLIVNTKRSILRSKKIFINIIYYFIITFCFFYFIQNYSLFCLQEKGGYPFINPLIPLAKYKYFQNFYKLIMIEKRDRLNNSLVNTQIFYLKPFKKKLSAISLGQIIYHQLAALNLHNNKIKDIIILAPETFFPFSFNKYQDLLKLWESVLPDNTQFLFGTQRSQKKKSGNEEYYQTVFWLNKDLIMDYYDKTHRMIFAEKTPKICKNIKFLFNISFKNMYFPFKKGRNLFNKSFKISNNLIVIPKICSEIFFINSRNINTIRKEEGIIISFVNDSWFLNYFKRIMKYLVILRSIQLEKSILYVNHKKISIIDIFI